MGEATQDRIARNNAVFREANEKIRAKAEQYDAPLEQIPFLCECASPSCVEIVRLTSAEYLEVRGSPQHFFTANGHEAAEGVAANVVSRQERHVVVEKPMPPDAEPYPVES